MPYAYRDTCPITSIYSKGFASSYACTSRLERVKFLIMFCRLSTACSDASEKLISGVF